MYQHTVITSPDDQDLIQLSSGLLPSCNCRRSPSSLPLPGRRLEEEKMALQQRADAVTAEESAAKAAKKEAEAKEKEKEAAAKKTAEVAYPPPLCVLLGSF